jgi:hypothetical protein
VLFCLKEGVETFLFFLERFGSSKYSPFLCGMEMINKTTDFRNWEVFLVKGDEDIIREHFNNQYPQNDIAVLEHLNNLGTFEITLLPKEN